MSKISKKNNVEWIELGGLWKTKSRPDMLKGKIKIPHLELEISVIAFIKTDDQKRNKNEADIRLTTPQDKHEENPFDDL